MRASLSVHIPIGDIEMKRFSHALLSLVAIFAVSIGFVFSADGQIKNQREVRDLIRSLTAQVDDFQYGLEFELRNNSAGSQTDANELNSGLRRLQDVVFAFDENFRDKRENRNDVDDIIAAAFCGVFRWLFCERFDALVEDGMRPSNLATTP